MSPGARWQQPWPPEDSYAHFYNLADQERQVHLSKADICAFVYALERFPSPWLQDGYEWLINSPSFTAQSSLSWTAVHSILLSLFFSPIIFRHKAEAWSGQATRGDETKSHICLVWPRG